LHGKPFVSIERDELPGLHMQGTDAQTSFYTIGNLSKFGLKVVMTEQWASYQ
jgi:hypothetical protein